MSISTAFFDRLSTAVRCNHSLLCVGLDPTFDRVPQRYRNGTDPLDMLLAWNVAVIEQTADLVCAFKPNIAFYEALGPQGYELLRRTMAAVPNGIPVILDAKRGDIGSTADAYARACFEVLGADAVTLSPYLGRDSIEPFFAYHDRAVFVLCHTSNPGAGEFQDLTLQDAHPDTGKVAIPPQATRLYTHIARSAISWSPRVGLVVGATYPDALATVRSVAPQAWILVPGIGAQGGDLEAMLAAGLRPDGQGLIVNAARGVTMAADHRIAAADLRDRINASRQNRHLAHTGSETLPQPKQRELIAELADLKAIRFGQFKLASGIESPIYIDLRLLVSRPAVLARVARAYASLLAGLPCDRIAGVPYAALPIGTAVSLDTGVPLIYPRKEVKEYGLGKDIEGHWTPGERVVIVEDLITSGGSTVKTAQRLRAAGLVVEHALVLIDREQGGGENLRRAGITAHSVFSLGEILDVLVMTGRLTTAKQAEVRAFLAKGP